MTVNLSQLTLEADPNKIPLKISFNMSKQNQIKGFPQNSHSLNSICKYQEFLCPVEHMYFLDEKSITDEI